MNKSILLVLVAIAVMLTAGSAIAAMKVSPNHSSSDADEQWKPQGGGAIGQNWSNAENWWHNAVPTGAQKAKINRVPGPIISGTVDINEFVLSEGNITTYEYPSCTAVITGDANVNVRKTLILSYYAADRGKLQIDGGTTTVNSHMFVGYGGNGEFTMNGGTLNILGNFAISFQGGNGSVKLNGGTLHIKQLTYEWALKEKANPTDPNIAITPGVASLDISGGQIVHDSNARDCNAVAAIYRTMATAGKLTAYNGQGDVVARINPATHQVNVTGQIILWDYSDITVTSHSTMDNDANRGIDRMFKSAVTDSNAGVFLDGPGIGGVYTAEWETPADVTVNSIEMIAERDSDANHFRAVRHFTLKAKIPSTSPTYNVILYDGDVTYTTNIYDLIYTLPAAQTASKFRAEFTGNDAKAVRIRELNAIGTRSAEHLWNNNQLVIVPGSSSVIMDPLFPGMYDIANMFENRRIDNSSAIFINQGIGAVYNVTFRPIEPGEIHSFEFVAEKDAIGNSRATTHLTLIAKSVGSDTYDKTLYDANIAIADYNNNVYRLNVNLDPANYVTAQEICAQFTGGVDANGVRVRELNALGVKTGIKQLWEPGNIVIGDRTQYQIYTQKYDIDNAFQKMGAVSDPCSDAAAFEDLGADTVYFVEWKTRSKVAVNAFHLLATHDSPSVPPPGIAMGRAMKHFKLKAKSVGSSTYNLTLYDADVAVPYNAPYDSNVLDLWVNLASPVTTREFRAEFTGNDAYGIRINELDAIGTILTPVGGDIDSDNNVDFKDFAVFADDWRIDNSASTSTQTLENFESYSAIPNTTWSNWLGQTSSNYNNLYLETTTVHGGSKALKWTYALDPGIVVGDDRSGIVYTLSTPVDLKNFSKFRVWINRKSGNSLENYLGVRFYWAGTLHDSKVQAEAKVLSVNGSTQTPAGSWSEWIVDLKNDLLFTNRTSTSNDDIYNVGTIVFYACNALQFTGGSGTIYVDDITLTSKCTSSDSDFNGDCKVNFKDLKVIADNWLKGF